jgi:predicted nucleic acid-binding protein
VIKAVIDTNVLVSGLLSPAGNEALIVPHESHDSTIRGAL